MKILKSNNNNVHFEHYEVYSDKEQVVGQWIDERPLYRKVINWTGEMAVGNNSIPHGITNLDIVLNCRLVDAYSTPNKTQFIVPYLENDKSLFIFKVTKEAVTFLCNGEFWGERNWILILEYTKK